MAFVARRCFSLDRDVLGEPSRAASRGNSKLMCSNGKVVASYFGWQGGEPLQ